MADSVDFNVDALRRAISTALVDTVINPITDPPSGEKDDGYAVGGVVDAAEKNSLHRNNYVLGRWLEEDMLPGLGFWGGLLGTEAAGAGLVQDSATNFAVDIAAGRFRLGGQTYTVPANAALVYPVNDTFTSRHDWVVVDVDTVARTAAYATVTGTAEATLPALAADQIPLAAIAVGNGPAGQDPTILGDVRFRPGPPRPITETLVFGAEAMSFNTVVDGDFLVDQAEGSIQQANTTFAFVPINLPIGARIEALRMKGLKNTPSLLTDGHTATLRRQDIKNGVTPTEEALGTVSSIALALSATPFFVENASLDLNVILPGYKYSISLTHASSVTTLTDRPRVWALEIDVVYGITPQT